MKAIIGMAKKTFSKIFIVLTLYNSNGLGEFFWKIIFLVILKIEGWIVCDEEQN